jgi:hypothetical protein
MIQIASATIRALKLPGGDVFTAFVDGLIRTHAWRHAIADAAIATNLRTNLGDQGADTVVRAALPGDTTGRFAAPSVWQYKATDYRLVGSNRDLLEGAYVRARIAEGFAFRLAIADSITPHQRDERVQSLNAACREISTAAPEALVVSADDLAEWANLYPAYVLRWAAPAGEGALVHLVAWGPSVRAATPTFVPIAQWDQIAAELRRHVDFAEPRAMVVLPIQGEAGVGKSRLVYEILRAVPGIEGFALYCNDEESAVQVARRLANAQAPAPVSAVLVADECGVGGRESIRQLLQGHRDRVRVIAIDNSGSRAAAGDPEFWVVKMPDQSLEQVLAQNYGHIAPERRRAYADLARGYPRLAADLCSHDALIDAAGGAVHPAMPSVREYLAIRLTPDQRQALAALSLVTKIGYRGDVAAEIDSLCHVLGLDRDRTVEALRQIRVGPGFVVVAGRYFYVTPEIVAHVGLADAWDRWGRDEPQEFLGRIPQSLLSVFLARIQRSAAPEVRRICGDYFRRWASELVAPDLVDVSIADRFATLVETDPTKYLSLLRRTLESSSLEGLRQISGTAWNGRWGSRRTLVWLAERLVRFPDSFGDAERILARLAAAESEPNIANNATGVWLQLFRIVLSGTPLSFAERLGRLRDRLRSDIPEIRALAMRAFEVIFSDTGIRMEGSPVVAGKIPPDEWKPKTRRDLFQAERQALMLAADVLRDGDPSLAEGVKQILVGHTRWLGLHGLIQELEKILRPVSLTEAERLRLMESLDEILIYDASRYPNDVTASVRRWRQSLTGDDLRSRMVALLGQRRWGAARLNDESAWLASVGQLATDFIVNGTDDDLAWLFQQSAHAAGEFGSEVGRRDVTARWLDPVLRMALQREERAFARGYVSGVVSTPDGPAERISAWLDDHEHDAPTVVADLALSGGDQLKAFDRVLRLSDRRAIPAAFLFDRNFARESVPTTEDRFEALLARLAIWAVEGDKGALQTGLDSIGLRLHGEQGKAILRRPRVRDSAWQLAESAVETTIPGASRYSDILEALGAFDPLRAARLAVRCLVGERLGDHVDAEAVLTALAKRSAVAVMQAVGEAVLNDKVGWKFYVHSFKTLVSSLPAEVVEQWISDAGVEGARRLARHLPVPHVEGGTTPVVPELTAWVLTKFEQDDRVFREFVAGVHSFQMYSGDIAAQHEAEAAVAGAFLDNPVRRIREWAEMEQRWALDAARQERQEAEERDLP